MMRNVRTDIPTNKHFDRQDKQEKRERERDRDRNEMHHQQTQTDMSKSYRIGLTDRQRNQTDK